MDEDKKKKRDRNRAYYERNKARLTAKARARYYGESRGAQIIPISNLSPSDYRSNLVAGHRVTLLHRFLEPVFLAALILASSYFLLTETVKFLTQTEADHTSAWLKALVGEGMIIGLSCAHVSGWQKKTARAILLLALFAFNLWAIAGGVVGQGQIGALRANLARQTVKELETEIRNADSIRVEYQEQGRDGLARRYERKLDALREKLHIARAEMLKSPAAENVRLNFSALAFFRLLVMLGNSLLIAHFSAFFRQRGAPMKAFAGG